MYESLKDSSPPWLDHNKITHGQQRRQTDTALAKCEQNELVSSQQEEPGQGANVGSEEIFHTVKQLGSHSQCCSCIGDDAQFCISHISHKQKIPSF